MSHKHRDHGRDPVALNNALVCRYLARLHPDRVWDLVHQAGHALPHESMVRTEVQRMVRDRAAAQVERDGASQIEVMTRQLIKERVQLRISSPEGDRVIREALNEAAESIVGSRDEALATACRRALAARVEMWLASPQGEEAFESLLAQALDKKICQAEARQRVSWITMRLKKLGVEAIGEGGRNDQGR